MTNRFKIFWSAWIVIGIASDIVVYVVWGKRFTLSEYTRNLLHLAPNTPRRRFGQVFIIAFLSWLGIHVVGDTLKPLPHRISGDYRRARKGEYASQKIG